MVHLTAHSYQNCSLHLYFHRTGTRTRTCWQPQFDRWSWGARTSAKARGNGGMVARSVALRPPTKSRVWPSRLRRLTARSLPRTGSNRHVANACRKRCGLTCPTPALIPCSARSSCLATTKRRFFHSSQMHPYDGGLPELPLHRPAEGIHAPRPDPDPSNHASSHGTDQARYLCWSLRRMFGFAAYEG